MLKNIDSGRGGSNEYQQCIFGGKIRKIGITLYIPVSLYKCGVLGRIRLVSVMQLLMSGGRMTAKRSVNFCELPWSNIVSGVKNRGKIAVEEDKKCLPCNVTLFLKQFVLRKESTTQYLMIPSFKL